MSTENSHLPEALQQALKRCDVLVGPETLEYYYQLYDPETGGFYYSISSRDSAGATPFAEGTCFTLESLLDAGLTIPQWYKDKVSAWILPHQDPDDGYFYEELWGKTTGGRRKDRDLTYSVIILRSMCGVEPLYPLPQDRLKTRPQDTSLSSAFPEYLAGKKEIIAYMDSLDWSSKSIWSTGSNLSAAVSMIQAAGLFDTVHEYIKAKQNPETGLWGEGLGWMNTNGTMKLSSFFDREHPFPRVEQIVDSILKIYSGDVPPSHATFIWNPFVALNSVLYSMGDDAADMRKKLYEKSADIVNRAVDCALLLRRPDGGFAGCLDCGSKYQQGFLYGLGLDNESDLDGTVIAGHRLRSSIHDVFGVPCSHDYYQQYEADFWERLKNKPPVVKTLPWIKTMKD